MIFRKVYLNTSNQNLTVSYGVLGYIPKTNIPLFPSLCLPSALFKTLSPKYLVQEPTYIVIIAIKTQNFICNIVALIASQLLPLLKQEQYPHKCKGSMNLSGIE